MCSKGTRTINLLVVQERERQDMCRCTYKAKEKRNRFKWIQHGNHFEFCLPETSWRLYETIRDNYCTRLRRLLKDCKTPWWLHKDFMTLYKDFMQTNFLRFHRLPSVINPFNVHRHLSNLFFFCFICAHVLYISVWNSTKKQQELKCAKKFFFWTQLLRYWRYFGLPARTTVTCRFRKSAKFLFNKIN